ncbi:MAG: B12-binding domain-containing radical SAM protein [Sodalinema sp.]|uniref:B12-binding domain-containing radical SAM protein n=1 Tax=Sodalinema sp. TaxID=3080550 RepID=UPI001206C2C9|nr:MAG: DUF4070 domain-containing protein [Phormidium sp. SL48-SHIP]
MRVLLLYPRFPKSFWSFEKTLELIGRKAMLPPLGLATVAAILPQTWDYQLVDRNVRDVTEAEWDWADVVLMSAMIVQKEDMLSLVTEAKRRGKLVAVGGPYPTAIPQDLEAVDTDYLILDEGEITLPMFVEAIARGEKNGVFRSNGEKPAVTDTPIPRFDLLDFDAYSEMSVQFSRGCPFQCEFCDIIVLYGRKPRTKSPEQFLAELDRLHELGWNRSIFLVDDNFIGNKRNVKRLLQALQPWMVDHNYPFSFATEASVDLAQDQELMDLMVACNFGSVFLGIETPDAESLAVTKKFQNTRDPLSDAVINISKSGLRVMAGFIIGFDGEKSGAGDRIVEFVEKTAIPTAVFSMLQALPDTALSHRLEKEGRLRATNGNINQTTLMNFVPTRPLEEIAREYIDAFWRLYDPVVFLNRTYRHFRFLGEATYPHKGKATRKNTSWVVIRALLTLCWRQGLVRKTRFVFWRNLWLMYRHNPGGISSYLSVCAQAEHFLEYRQIVKDEIEAQLADYLAQEERKAMKAASEPAPSEVAV